MEDINTLCFLDDYIHILLVRMDLCFSTFNIKKDKTYLELYIFYSRKLAETVKSRRHFTPQNRLFDEEDRIR